MLEDIYAASLSFATNTLHLFIMNKYNCSFCLPNVIATQKKVNTVITVLILMFGVS